MSGAFNGLRFMLPPSLGKDAMTDRAARLQKYFTAALNLPAEVSVAESYDGLAKQILSGRLEAAWAPPFVCARVEAMGVRVLMRGVRRGASTYRAVLLGRADQLPGIDQLAGKTALWTDKNSVGGYLLVMAFLKSKGLAREDIDDYGREGGL